MLRVRVSLEFGVDVVVVCVSVRVSVRPPLPHVVVVDELRLLPEVVVGGAAGVRPPLEVISTAPQPSRRVMVSPFGPVDVVVRMSVQPPGGTWAAAEPAAASAPATMIMCSQDFI